MRGDNRDRRRQTNSPTKRDIWYKGGDGGSVVLSSGGGTDYSAQISASPTDGRTVLNGLPTSAADDVYGIQEAGGSASRKSSSNKSNNTSNTSDNHTHNTLGPHSSDTSTSSHSSLSTGPIIGIVVGIVAFAFFVCLFFGKYRRRANRRRMHTYARAQGMARAQAQWGDAGVSSTPAADPATLKSQHSRSYSEATHQSSFNHLGNIPKHLRKESNTSSLVPSETEKSNSVVAAPWFRGSGTTAHTSDDYHSRGHEYENGMARSDSDTSRFRRARNSFGSPLDML